MKKGFVIKHEFVEYIPNVLEDRIIYISVEFATAVHSCFCGCGNKVVTPLSPTDWRLTFNGETVSLYPSIGNWNLECKSHYWIRNNRVEWAREWSRERIDTARKREREEKARYYRDKNRETSDQSTGRSKRKWSWSGFRKHSD